MILPGPSDLAPALDQFTLERVTSLTLRGDPTVP